MLSCNRIASPVDQLPRNIKYRHFCPFVFTHTAAIERNIGMAKWSKYLMQTTAKTKEKKYRSPKWLTPQKIERGCSFWRSSCGTESIIFHHLHNLSLPVSKGPLFAYVASMIMKFHLIVGGYPLLDANLMPVFLLFIKRSIVRKHRLNDNAY